MIKLVETYNSDTMEHEAVLLDNDCKPSSLLKKLLISDVIADVCVLSIGILIGTLCKKH